MKIIDKELSFFGKEIHFRIVPKQYRRDLSKVGLLIFRAKMEEAEKLLDEMRRDYCAGFDDVDMMPLRDQIKSFKVEIGL